MKKRLDEAKGGYVNELPSVLGVYRMTPRRSTGKPPFSLAYGMETVILLEIRLPTTRKEAYSHKKNKERIAKQLNMIEERREQSLIKLAAYQQQLARSFQRKVRERIFKVGDDPEKSAFEHQRLQPWQTRSEVTELLPLVGQELTTWKRLKGRRCQGLGTLRI